MNESVLNIRPARVFALVLGLVFAAVASATLSAIAGGWVLNWMVPVIRFEFACLIFGQGLLLTAIPLGVLGNGFLRYMRDEKMFEDDGRFDDEDDEDDGEEAEWLAERIADLMLARMNQAPARERRYTPKARSKK